MGNENPGQDSVPKWLHFYQKQIDFFSQDLGGGPKKIKIAWVINTEKYGAILSFAFFMWYYQNTSPAAWTYLALETGYSLIWIIKHYAFPDRSWETRITYAGAIWTFFSALIWYWVMGWVLASGLSKGAYPIDEKAWLCLCVAVCIIGCVIMTSADAQKYFTLRLRSGLISDGMFKYIRHPNYLGEMIIYTSFAMVIWHWIPVAILACIWIGLFAPNMIFKEARMSRHAEWSAYKKKTWWLVPFIF